MQKKHFQPRHSHITPAWRQFSTNATGRPQFFAAAFFLLRLREADDPFFAGRPVLFAALVPRFGAGTLAPFFRASDKPMAIACLRLVTFFSDLPERNVPFFFLRIADLTDFCAPFEYFAMQTERRFEAFFKKLCRSFMTPYQSSLIPRESRIRASKTKQLLLEVNCERRLCLSLPIPNFHKLKDHIRGMA